MNQTSGDSGDEQCVVDLHLNDVIELLLSCGQHVIELLRLGNRARESVENESIGRIEERLAHYANGQSKLHSDEGSTVKRRELPSPLQDCQTPQALDGLESYGFAM